MYKPVQQQMDELLARPDIFADMQVLYQAAKTIATMHQLAIEFDFGDNWVSISLSSGLEAVYCSTVQTEVTAVAAE